jgi:hypothetical protein
MAFYGSSGNFRHAEAAEAVLFVLSVHPDNNVSLSCVCRSPEANPHAGVGERNE